MAIKFFEIIYPSIYIDNYIYIYIYFYLSTYLASYEGRDRAWEAEQRARIGQRSEPEPELAKGWSQRSGTIVGEGQAGARI